MTTKEEVLQDIKTLAQQKLVTKEEIEHAYEAGSGISTPSISKKRIGIAEILYYIGGGVVVLGIAILISQNWSMLGFGARALVTLGSGFAAYYVGIMLSRYERTETVGTAFHLIAALVLPIGLWVVFENSGFGVETYASQSMISGILFAAYFLSYAVFRKDIFVLFSVIFATWFYYVFAAHVFGTSRDWERDLEYLTLIAGVAYILLGRAFSKSERAPLSGFLYGFGIFGFLGAALMLGGSRPDQNIFWELIYPVLVFGTLFASVHIKNKAFLMWGTFFLMAYILKLTSEYFSGSLGWPLALVVAGFAMIGVGYVSLSIKKKYLTD